MQGNVDHNRGQIKILSKIMKYNSNTLQEFRKTQIHRNDVLKQSAFQVNETTNEINEMKISMVCVNLKLSLLIFLKL